MYILCIYIYYVYKPPVSLPEYIVAEGPLARTQLHKVEGGGTAHLDPLVKQPDAQTLPEHLADNTTKQLTICQFFAQYLRQQFRGFLFPCKFTQISESFLSW